MSTNLNSETMSNVDLSKYNDFINRLLKTKEELEVDKGSPKKVSQEDDLYYWYGSIVAHKAEIYRIHNNHIVWLAIDLTNDKLSVNDFVELWGEPEYSVKRYEEADSFHNKVLAWPSKGRVLLVNGDSLYSRVVRMEFFQPETLDQYLTNWGKDYANKEKVNLLVTPTPFTQLTPTVTQPEQQTVFANSQIRNEFALLFIVVAIALFFAFLSLKRKKSKNP